MEDEKKIEEKKPLRQIIIETDGDNIRVVKAEVAGSLEFKSILQTLLAQFSK